MMESSNPNAQVATKFGHSHNLLAFVLVEFVFALVNVWTVITRILFRRRASANVFSFAFARHVRQRMNLKEFDLLFVFHF